MPYFVNEGGKPAGPFEPAELMSRPGLSASTLVCPAGATSSDAWKPAASFPELAGLLKPAAPPLPGAAGAFRSEMTLSLPPGAVQAAMAPAGPPLASPADKLLLVIDDDDAVRGFIEMGATMQGFQVVVASNGLEASKKLAERKPDLIIADLMMPGQGGYEFLRTLAGAGASKLPVFVVTGSVLDDSTVALIRGEANVVEFIAKPVKLDAFVKALHKHLKTAPKQ